jgi:hypothetical protein
VHKPTRCWNDLKAFEQGANLFPGFEVEAQGFLMGGLRPNSRFMPARLNFGGTRFVTSDMATHSRVNVALSSIE